MWPNAQVPGDLVRLTEEIVNGKNSFFVQYLQNVYIITS